jgi:hypothetical protein
VEVHGNGANIDGFETRTRVGCCRTCFSIEPGIYLPASSACAVSSTVYVDGGKAVVTGEPFRPPSSPIFGERAAQ